EVLQNRVLEAKVFHTEYGTGVAILTGAHRFSLTTNVDDLKLRRMPEVPGLQKPPSCWAVLSQDRVTIILLAVGQDLYLLDNTSCSVVVSGLRRASVGRSAPPALAGRSLPWLESGPEPSVAAALPGSPGRRRPCSRSAEGRGQHGLPRAPGLRGGMVEERAAAGAGGAPGLGVPLMCFWVFFFPPICAEASQEIFKIASMAPGALLLEAQKEYEKESQKADEYLREIKDQKLLAEAVSQCIEAAGYEHEPDTQKSLLRAASFGKCFVDKFPPESFVRMCQDLRVLNAIRDYQIGIPLTFTQYKRLTIEVLLDRLVLRRLYPLAIRICEYLRLSEIQGVSRILAHWACYKVQQKDKSDEEVAHAINQKLGDTPGISYSEIAARAYDCGRTELAIKV
ncbi:VPS16 protein, partial [Lophotis ruficrista]|nr:VPS16 protein [Lophotis ruficrista]